MKRERSIVALVLLVVLLAVIYIVRDEADMISNERKHFWVMKTHSEETAQVLFAGDSRTYRGMSPDDFSESFYGAKVLNLGYVSNGFHSDYLDFLERKLDVNTENKVIVCGVTPYAFSRKGSRSSHYRGEQYDRKKEEILKYQYMNHFSRMVIPFDLKKIVSGRRIKKEKLSYQETFHSNGWVESTWLYPDSTNALKSYATTFTDNMFDVEGAETFFRRVHSWTEEGITVVGVRIPTTYAMRALEDSLSGFNEALFREEFVAHGGDWIVADFDKYSSYDGSHLDNESAKLFSKNLGIEVKHIFDVK